LLANQLTPFKNLDGLNVGVETPLGAALGVAHIVANLGSFAAVFALRHDSTCLRAVFEFKPRTIVP
jgi:hypothetical protein